jgi:uncharacterized protein (TIGR02058 family)
MARVQRKLQVRQKMFLCIHIKVLDVSSHGHVCHYRTPVRACRNAIEFNSIPSVRALVPGGYDGLKLDVLLAIPPKYKDSLDLEKVKDVFPYGSIRFQIQDGGQSR